jgi:sugar lactone lactonase YvrE
MTIMGRIRAARAGGPVFGVLLLGSGCGGGNPGGVVDMHPASSETCPATPGTICTVAGSGIAGDGADGQAALATRLYLPQDMTVGPDGRLYVVDWNNHRIRAVNPDGTMTIVAGIGELGPNVDDPSSDRLNHPTNVTFDAHGLMVIAAWHNSRVKTVDLSLPEPGNIVNICGTGKRGFGGNGGPAAAATLDLPAAVAFDAAGNLFIADQANQMIRRVDAATGVIETVAGKTYDLAAGGQTGHCADAQNPAPCVPFMDDVPARDASFHLPVGQAATPGGRIALDATGNIYIADTENFRVRVVDTAGIVHTFAGTGVDGFAGDGGPASAAQLSRVTDVAVAPDGSVYIADTENSCVRLVTPAGIMTTFAGTCGQPGFAGDRGPAAAALLDRPSGVEIAPSGAIYIADTHNQRVRVVHN